MRTDDPLNDQVRHNIRAEMTRRDVSQRGLAEALGVAQSSLNRMLKGHQALRLADVGSIARALMVDPDVLLRKTTTRRRRVS
jgi:transcriptional regulator with XRE-family HTH domain